MNEADGKWRPLSQDEATNPSVEEPTANVRAWQDEKVREGIKAADAGSFASAEDVRRVVRKYVGDWA